MCHWKFTLWRTTTRKYWERDHTQQPPPKSRIWTFDVAVEVVCTLTSRQPGHPKYWCSTYIHISQVFQSGLTHPFHEEVSNCESGVNVTLKVPLHFNPLIHDSKMSNKVRSIHCICFQRLFIRRDYRATSSENHLGILCKRHVNRRFECNLTASWSLLSKTCQYVPEAAERFSWEQVEQISNWVGTKLQ